MAVKLFTGGKRLPDPEWVSFPEPIATGDGERTTFPIPFDLEGYDGVQFSIDLAPLVDEAHEVKRDHESGAWSVTLRNPPPRNASLGLSAFGRQDAPLAFQIRPITRSVNEAVRAELGKELAEKLRKLDAAKSIDAELDVTQAKKFYESMFVFFVVGWSGVEDDHGEPIACTPETRRMFLEQMDAGIFMPWVMSRARELGFLRITRSLAAKKN